MGYEVQFRNIPTEILDKYNKKNKGYCGYTNNEYRLTVETYVLQEPPKKDDNTMLDVKSGVFTIKLYLAGIESEIIRDEEQWVYDQYQEYGYINYCGWQYSHESSNQTREEIYNYVVERLTLLKYCTTTGDYFAEHNNFQEKLNEIKDVLEYFDDMIRDIKRFEIMNELKEYRVSDDYEDDEDNETRSPSTVSSFGEVIIKHDADTTKNLLNNTKQLDPVKEITEKVKEEEEKINKK